MPKVVKEYQCMLISPSDVQIERQALANTVMLWNAHVGVGRGVRIRLMKWEIDVLPGFEVDPQGIINGQITDTCDLGIAVFWTRLGSPTLHFASGSKEEIESLIARKARVMVYFCTADLPQSKFDPDQYDALQRFRRSLESRGIVGRYSSVDELEKKVFAHLSGAIDQLENASSILFDRKFVDAAVDAVRKCAGQPTQQATHLQTIQDHLLAPDIGIAHHAFRALDDLVTSGAIPPQEFARAKSTKISWEIRRDAVRRIRVEQPGVALPILNSFASSAWHQVQEEIRKYVDPLVDDGHSDCTVLREMKSLLERMNTADITPATRANNNRMVARLERALSARGCP